MECECYDRTTTSLLEQTRHNQSRVGKLPFSVVWRLTCVWVHLLSRRLSNFLSLECFRLKEGPKITLTRVNHLHQTVPLFAAASLFFLKTLTTTAAAMEATKPIRSDRVRGAILGAISADALCLGKLEELFAVFEFENDEVSYLNHDII